MLFLSLVYIAGCREPESTTSWSATELVSELDTLEQGDPGATKEDQRLADFAQRAVHASVGVSDAHVVSVYERDADWLTRPYFALSYDPDTYIYLEER